MDDILVPYSSCPLLVQLLRWTVRLTKEGLLKIQRECFVTLMCLEMWYNTDSSVKYNYLLSRNKC